MNDGIESHHTRHPAFYRASKSTDELRRQIEALKGLEKKSSPAQNQELGIFYKTVLQTIDLYEINTIHTVQAGKIHYPLITA